MKLRVPFAKITFKSQRFYHASTTTAKSASEILLAATTPSHALNVDEIRFFLKTTLINFKPPFSLIE